MAKTQPKSANRIVDSFTIQGTKQVIKAGDSVLMKSTEAHPYVALVDQIEVAECNNFNVTVRWYYRPEDTPSGRMPFHGAKEVFRSDHTDVQSSLSIISKCIVHKFEDYIKLKMAGNDDYYARCEYKTGSQALVTDDDQVYCLCRMPYNPDDLMIQCEKCQEWFHPKCLKLTVEDIAEVRHFLCRECFQMERASKNKDKKKKAIASVNGKGSSSSAPSTIADKKRPKDSKRPTEPGKCERKEKHQKGQSTSIGKRMKQEKAKHLG